MKLENDARIISKCRPTLYNPSLTEMEAGSNEFLLSSCSVDENDASSNRNFIDE